MRIILVPGLWLDASSWDPILPVLTDAGHEPVPLTLPGVGASAGESADIGISDWVDAVVAQIDAAADPVVLVGHSGGGNVAWGAADARPTQVARVVFVDSAPPPDGVGISEFDIVDGVVPFPGWDFFDEPDVADLDEQTRTRTAAQTASVPAKVPTDRIRLRDERRYAVPVTVLSGGADEAGMREMLAEWEPWNDEFAAISDVEVVTLDTGHWPQFSQPERLAEAIVDAVR